MVGFQRSGTTLLQALLGAHSRIAAPPETHYLFRIAHLADYFGDLRDDASLRRALHDALFPPVPLFAGCGFDEDRIYQRAFAGPRTYGALLDAIMSDFADRHDKPRWSEKTPGQPLADVLHLWPDAQAIHIIRDPRLVVASSKRVPWELMPPPRVAATWASFTRANVQRGRAAGPRSYHEMRYEDLVADPETVLRALCTFLDEEYEPSMVEDRRRRQHALPAVVSPWHRRVLDDIQAESPPPASVLTIFQRARVAAKLGQLPAHLGYPSSRRGVLSVGRLLNVLALPASLPHFLERLRLRWDLRNPESHYRAAHRWMGGRVRSVQLVQAGTRTDAGLSPMSGIHPESPQLSDL